MSEVVKFLRRNRAAIDMLGFERFAELNRLVEKVSKECPVDIVRAMIEIEKITGKQQAKLFGEALACKCNNAMIKFLKFMGAIP